MVIALRKGRAKRKCIWIDRYTVWKETRTQHAVEITMEKGVVRKIKFIFTKNLFTKYERGEPPAVSMKYGLLLADPLQAKGAGVCL